METRRSIAQQGICKIELMAESDASLVKEIEIECELAPWGTDDYQSETARTDSVCLIAKVGQKTIGFAIMRLITISNNYFFFYS